MVHVGHHEEEEVHASIIRAITMVLHHPAIKVQLGEGGGDRLPPNQELPMGRSLADDIRQILTGCVWIRHPQVSTGQRHRIALDNGQRHVSVQRWQLLVKWFDRNPEDATSALVGPVGHHKEEEILDDVSLAGVDVDDLLGSQVELGEAGDCVGFLGDECDVALHGRLGDAEPHILWASGPIRGT